MEASIEHPISSLSLSDLREKFALKRDRSNSFFNQWLAEAEQLSDFEQQALARLNRNYENITETNPLEEVVKLVVVAPKIGSSRILSVTLFHPYRSIHTSRNGCRSNLYRQN